jgi:chromatin structure-remodeling complex subunit RSC9
MAMLEENAEFLSRLFPLRDFLSIALNLPVRPTTVEMKHYALDIAEQVTKYYSLRPEDPLYISLLAQLNTSDRGAILTSLRAISRISMHLEENNRLVGVPVSTVTSISDWTLLDDEELVHACLDFLYQYTALVDNVSTMVTEMPMAGLINQLVRLLLHGAKPVEVKKMIKPPSKKQPASEIPALPNDLLEQLLKLDEPSRSTHW